MAMSRLLFALSCVLATCAAGHLSQKYLPASRAAAPSNQYLAPHGNQQLHYHGVSGQGHPRSGGGYGGHGGGGGGGGHGGGFGQRNAGAQIPIVRSDYESDANGNYNFGFETGNGIHRDETGEFNGGWPHGSLGVRGSYSYTGDDGKQYTVNYKADKNGFQAEGAHIPTSHTSQHGGAHQQRSSAGGYGGGAGGYHAAASNAHAPSSRYLPPSYRQRRHY